MRRFFLSTAVLLSLVPAGVSASGVHSGLHPWEVRAHRYSEEIDRVWDINYEELYEFYYDGPHRSKTHALHPYHRKRYYSNDPYVVLGRYDRLGNSYHLDGYEFDENAGFWVRTEDVEASGRGRTCDDYTYDRPNYRVPPFNYDCNVEPIRASKKDKKEGHSKRPSIRRAY